jgi:hypothetical protein
LQALPELSPVNFLVNQVFIIMGKIIHKEFGHSREHKVLMQNWLHVSFISGL